MATAEITRESLRKHWCELLRVDDALPEQNFFDLGGDSLSAMELVSRVQADTGWELPLELLFGDETFAGIESRIG